MSSPLLSDVFNASRAYLNDQAAEVYTNNFLQLSFAEPYRRLFACLMGSSKRVERTVYINLPFPQNVLIPQTVNLTDMSEPELVEERASGASVNITSTTAATPIVVYAPVHGFGTVGQQMECIVSQIANTTAPWGLWFIQIVDADHFTLLGSMTDGTAGTGGIATLPTAVKFSSMVSTDFARDLDGTPTQNLGTYLWENERFMFRGASQPQQLRITYWASGSPPTNVNTTINIDNCLDFLACATAANAARSNGWSSLADSLKFTAYGSSQDTAGGCSAGLLGDFIRGMVATLQRGPQRRQRPFRAKRTRYGDALLG
jgi:hypothetical protein